MTWRTQNGRDDDFCRSYVVVRSENEKEYTIGTDEIKSRDSNGGKSTMAWSILGLVKFSKMPLYDLTVLFNSFQCSLFVTCVVGWCFFFVRSFVHFFFRSSHDVCVCFFLSSRFTLSLSLTISHSNTNTNKNNNLLWTKCIAFGTFLSLALIVTASIERMWTAV